jgi:hypothetical protein
MRQQEIYLETTMTLSETLKDWLYTFWKILISPTPNTFIQESEKAENKFSSVIGWSIFIAIYAYIVPAIAGYPFDFTILILSLIILPLVIVLVPSATQFILQRAFHRKQYLYDKLLYIYAAILILFQLIINPISFFVPSNTAAIFNYILVVYQFVLLVIAVKAIANINYWQAIITILFSVIVGAVILFCALPFITSLIGGVSGTLR